MKLLALPAALTLTGSLLSGAHTGYAGTWHVSFYLRCNNTPQNSAACSAIEQSNDYAMGIRGTVFIDSMSGDIKSDARGHWQGRLTGSYTERSKEKPPRCSVGAVDSQLYNGSCRYLLVFSGVVARSSRGLVEFVANTFKETVYDGKTIGGTTGGVGPIDTYFPARSGTWTTGQIAAWIGVKPAPGVSARITVKRS